jgi:minor histocompatibility antigen H13
MDNLTSSLDTLSEAVKNMTEFNSTSSKSDSSEGLFVAYISLFVMALLPIYFGSIRSVKTHINKKITGEEVDTITGKDAAMFPLIASGALFGIFLFFKIFSKEYINLLLAFYFFVIGIFAVAHMINPVLRQYIPDSVLNSTYQFIVLEEKEHHVTTESQSHVTASGESSQTDRKKELVNFTYQRKDLLGLAVAIGIGVWYLAKKHWIANNIFGLAFSVNAVELLALNKVMTGCILLGGLFFYDIFWVFATDVMVTVAKSFEAPIKLVFPRDLLINGMWGNNFAMLGLGDIVVPGIFIALLLRYDHSLRPGSRFYFYSGFVAYILGLATTIFVMHVFKHAQPALLYLVPSCLGIPIGLALIRGDIKNMFNYEDHPPTAEEEDTKAEVGNGEQKKDK